MTPAHDPVAPSELWSAWQPDPLVVATVGLSAVVYGQGLARLRRRRRRSVVRSTQVTAFYGGLLALAVALASPLETAAGSLFSAHMVQHLVLILVAAPLLACGRPALVAAMALPVRGRRRLRRATSGRAARRGVELATHPVTVWVVGTAVLWAWHLPALYESAVAHDVVHALEHATLVGAAALLWGAVVDRGRRPLAVPAAVILLFATGLQGAALGAVLALARTPLYRIHEPGPELWGLTPLEDQQLAGGLMWVPPGLVYLATMATLLVRWLTPLDRVAAPAAVGAAGEGAP